MGRKRSRVRDAPPRVMRARIGGVRIVIASAPTDPPRVLHGLTPAELAVARLVVSGMTNAEIGRVRRVSRHTVANQVAAILRKLGLGSRLELVALFDT